MNTITLKRFALIKLKKTAYDYRHTDNKCDLLVLRSISREVQDEYLVRYPDNFVQQVNINDVTLGYICNMGMPNYIARSGKMPAVHYEYEHNPKFRELYNRYVQEPSWLHITDKTLEKYTSTEDCTTPLTIPRIPVAPVPDPVITILPDNTDHDLLVSIDATLKELLALQKGEKS